MLSKQTHTDQLGRVITIPLNPQRIISVVPSQTELLFDLGLAEQIIAVTKFCTHPKNAHANKVKIGGTKQLDIEKIKFLQPDLIIANKEENERSQIEELMHYFPVWISDIANIDDALSMIENVGEITGKSTKARQLKDRIKEGFQQLIPIIKPLSAAYLIWRNPYMVAGSDTYINDMLSQCGLINCIKQTRYPEVDVVKMQQLNPDVVLLSSEPYPFKQKHIEEFMTILPNAKVILVDGEMFSWYGSRLQYALGYFAEIIKMLENQSRNN